MAIFTKKGKLFDTTGQGAVRAGPVEQRLQGLRRQLRSPQQRRRRRALRPARGSLADRAAAVLARARAAGSDRAGAAGRRAAAACPASRISPAPRPMLFQPPPPAPTPATRRAPPPGAATAVAGRPAPQSRRVGPYSMCYAISATPDPLGAYYRYEFLRPLFPDYPRPAIWTDGYYVPTSTSDNRISDDRRHREARVRRRSREDAEGRAGHRAVRHHRRRQLPQQRGHRRQDPAARRARRTS